MITQIFYFKTINTLTTYELQGRLSGTNIRVNAVDPEWYQEQGSSSSIKQQYKDYL